MFFRFVGSVFVFVVNIPVFQERKTKNKSISKERKKERKKERRKKEIQKQNQSHVDVSPEIGARK
jgi:hypothetical protein